MLLKLLFDVMRAKMIFKMVNLQVRKLVKAISIYLMFVPCIAGLGIKNQHCALSFVNIYITNAASTCFGTYMPSSGSVLSS
jgi:putative effector of murein hydrolase LrgA (UPF0299 family)